jgi:hypothetical protein
MVKFDPMRPDLPFPGLGLMEISALCKYVTSLAETDRHSLVNVARQAEAWQRRAARVALAGAEVSKALADVVAAVGTPSYPQVVQALGWAIGDHLVAVSGLDSPSR